MSVHLLGGDGGKIQAGAQRMAATLEAQQFTAPDDVRPEITAWVKDREQHLAVPRKRRDRPQAR